MTQPMSREQIIQTEALIILHGGHQNDPTFYAAKQNFRRLLSEPKPVVLIEFLEDQITVIDHDMTVHTI